MTGVGWGGWGPIYARRAQEYEAPPGPSTHVSMAKYRDSTCSPKPAQDHNRLATIQQAQKLPGDSRKTRLVASRFPDPVA